MKVAVCTARDACDLEKEYLATDGAKPSTEIVGLAAADQVEHFFRFSINRSPRQDGLQLQLQACKTVRCSQEFKIRTNISVQFQHWTPQKHDEIKVTACYDFRGINQGDIVVEL